MSCTDCTDQLDHCHGALVVHQGFAAECTEPGCTPTDPARHGLPALACTELDRSCACGGDTTPALALAS